MPRKLDEGFPIIVTVQKESDGEPLNIAGAQTRQILFRKPGESAIITKTAVLSGDGSDGKMQYVVESGFLDATIWWEVEGYVEIDGLKVRSSRIKFPVTERLE